MPKETYATYRTADFSKTTQILLDDPFEYPPSIKRGRTLFLHVRAQGGEGWQFRDYEAEDGEVLHEMVFVETAPETFIRDGKTYTMVFGVPNLFAGSALETSQQFKTAMQKINKRLPKRCRSLKDNKFGIGT